MDEKIKLQALLAMAMMTAMNAVKLPVWKKKVCSNCNKEFETTKKNKNCCSAKCHEELVKKQKKKRKKI